MICWVRSATRAASSVAADRDRMPARHVGRARGDHVAQEPHRGVDREAPLLLGDVLLEDVRLDGPAEAIRRYALPLRCNDVEGHHDRGRRVDRHRHRHVAEVDPAEQVLHVVERVDGNWRIVHSRPRYMLGYTPRVNGYSPGSPMPLCVRRIRRRVERLYPLAGESRERRRALRHRGVRATPARAAVGRHRAQLRDRVAPPRARHQEEPTALAAEERSRERSERCSGASSAAPSGCLATATPYI